jgi:hypothetical protein
MRGRNASGTEAARRIMPRQALPERVAIGAIEDSSGDLR